MMDGIYFDLPESEYHEIERLSSTGICNMLISPPTFWARSWLNPDREQDNEDTLARRIGKAYHTALLEPHLLDQRFVSEIDLNDYPEVLKTGKDIEQALSDAGYPKKTKGEVVIDQARRLANAGYTGPILPLLAEQWESHRGDRAPIPADAWQQIHKDADFIASQPDIGRHMTGGYAEVSVLWTDEATGIKMKCRFDYLKTDSFVDLKTYDNTKGKEVEQCIADAFRYNRYYIQCYVYWTAAQTIREYKVSAPESHPWNKAQTEFVNSIRSSIAPLEPWYIFMEKKQVPNVMARNVQILRPIHPSHYHNDAGVSHETSEAVGQKTRRLSSLGMKAEVEVNRAMYLYNFYLERFERGQPWTSLVPTGAINDDSFNPYWLDLGKDN